MPPHRIAPGRTRAAGSTRAGRLATSSVGVVFQEKAIGSLEVGKQADLVVLDRNYMTVPAADIKHIHPTLTMVGGRVVYGAAK